MVAADRQAPRDLPFLDAISWYDRDPRDLRPEEMLARYEAGWRFLGVLCDPSPEERQWIRYLVDRYGSTIEP